MEITWEINKRLQEVGRALSETNAPLFLRQKGLSARDHDSGHRRHVIVDVHVPWAGNDAEKWLAVCARRDHVYAHLRYTSRPVWNRFAYWVQVEEEAFKDNREKGFPSAAFALDLFGAIEDARVDRAWAAEYPGTAGRTIYYHRQSANSLPVLSGSKALIMSFYYLAATGKIPPQLRLTPEERKIVTQSIPFLEKGRKAATSRKARDWTIQILKICRSYLQNQEEKHEKIMPEPETAEKPKEASPEEKDNLQRDEEIEQLAAEEEKREKSTQRKEDKIEFAAEHLLDGEAQEDVQSEDSAEEPAEKTAENKSNLKAEVEESEVEVADFPADRSVRNMTEQTGEVSEDEHGDNDPDERSQALSTPGPKATEQSLREEDSKAYPDKTPEEEYQQLLAGAEREMRRISHREDRVKWVLKRKEEEEQLEKGIHEFVVYHEIEAGELEKHFAGDFENLTPANKIKNKYRKQIMDLSREIREVLLYKKTLPERSLRKGWPDTKNLWKLSMGDTSVFRKKNVEASRPDISILFLVDCSRSMRRNRRSELCKQSLVITAEALKRNQVKFAIQGFTTGYQCNTVLNINFKTFEETDIDNLDYYSGFNENRDGYSIRRTSGLLKRRFEEKRILIVLSDSVPNHTNVDRAEMNYSFEVGKGIKDTKLAIRETIREGIIVLGVFFGDEQDIERVRPIYPNFVHCEVLNLPRVLGWVLRRALK